MPLSCDCDWDHEPEPGQWEFDHYYSSKLDFEQFTELRRKRCISCKELINWNDLCLKFERSRHPYTEVEARIHGVDWEEFEEPVIGIPPVYTCEKCGEIYLNLTSVGFECLSPNENMPKMLKQYQRDYAPPPLLTEAQRELKLNKMENVVDMYKQKDTRRFARR
jgi:hypothetical protein